MSSSERDDPSPDTGDAADGRPEGAARRRSWQLPAAFAAVAVLAATLGAVVAGSGSGSEDAAPSTSVTSAPSAADDGGGSEPDQVELLATPPLVEGERRGFDGLRDGGEVAPEDALVTTDLLAEQIELGLEEQDIVLIDISEEQAASTLTRYVDGHIPGAQQVDWGTDIVRANTREFITQDEFTALAQRLGIDEGSTVVLYGDNNNWFAAYGAWIFSLYGVQDVRLLDGGLLKWEQVDGRELVQEVPQPAPGDFVAQPQNLDLRAFQTDVLDIVEGDAPGSLIDIRSPAEFNGETGVNLDTFPGEGAAVWGHIPGAINVPWAQIVDEEDGTFLPPEEIRAVYEDAGVDFDQPIVAYCRIGERASHTWFALTFLLGSEATVYDGSWSEYGNTVGLPVQNESGIRGGVWG